MFLEGWLMRIYREEGIPAYRRLWIVRRHTGIPCVPCFSDADLVWRIGLFVGEGHVPRISDLVETSLSTDG